MAAAIEHQNTPTTSSRMALQIAPKIHARVSGGKRLDSQNRPLPVTAIFLILVTQPRRHLRNRTDPLNAKAGGRRKPGIDRSACWIKLPSKIWLHAGKIPVIARRRPQFGRSPQITFCSVWTTTICLSFVTRHGSVWEGASEQCSAPYGNALQGNMLKRCC